MRAWAFALRCQKRATAAHDEAAEARKAANKAAREAKNRLGTVETEIHSLEERQKELVAELEDPATFSNGKAFSLNRELADLQERLTNLLEEWDALSATMPADSSEPAES